MKVILKGRTPLVLDDFPPDAQRSREGSLHFRPGSLMEITNDEYRAASVIPGISFFVIESSEVAVPVPVKESGPRRIGDEELLANPISKVKDGILSQRVEMTEEEYAIFIQDLISLENAGRSRSSLIRFLQSELGLEEED